MSTDKYILIHKKVVPEPNMTKWGEWMQHSLNEEKRVGRTTIKNQPGEILVSTVFLGLDHSFREGPPLLFETLVFGGELNEEMERCSTWVEAEAMHKQMVKRVKQAEKK